MGGILADGSILDVVETGGKLQLYHWDGEREVVAPIVEYNDAIYQLPWLDPSLREVIKFPCAPADFGSASELFTTAQSVFLERGFSSEAAGWGSVFALTSWVPEALTHLPTLLICGSNMRMAEVFFSTLSCLCRRPLLAAQLSRALPFWVKPTLLIMTAEMAAKERSFWSAANVRGVQVALSRGRVEEFASPRALFVQDPEHLQAWGPEVWQLSLISEPQVSPATDLDLARTSRDFQNRFFSFRLHHLLQANSNPSNLTQTFKDCQSRQLFAIAQDDRELLGKITPLFEQQQRDFLESQKRDPNRAIVEVLWPQAHTTNDVTVTDLVGKVNALLDSRGASFDFDEPALGRRLRELGLERKRQSKGKFLHFSPELRYQVHRRARSLGLDLSKSKGCRDCEEMI